MEYRGFPVNYEKYSLFNENNKRTRDEKEKALLEFLQTRGGKRELPKRIQQEDIFGGLVDVKSTNDINVGSWQQVLPIYQEMGIPIASTDQKIIGPLVNEYPELKYLIEHREWAKLCSAFGDSLLEKIDNGRIYADMWQLGTITLRISCSNPNLQQLPSDKDCRACFSAPDGRKLVIADYSTFELRILAEIADDAVMIDAFNSGKDLHSMTASKVFGIPYEEIMKEKKGIHKDKRDSAKMGNFAICYGINPIALMNRIKGAGVDCDEETAKKIIDGFYDTYAGAKRWLFGQERKILQNRHIKGIGGHRITVDYIRGDKSSERSAGRDARNYPIQNCVRHDSLVLSKYEGLVPISSLVDKNDLELWDGDRFVNCEKVVFSGKKQNYKIRLMSGIEINCSPEHKFLTFNSHGTEKWRTAKEISELKQVYIKLTSEMNFHNEVTLEGFINSADRYKVTSSNSRDLSLISINDSRELGLFLGRVASDGQVDTTKVVCIVAEHEKSVLDDLSSILKDFPFKIRHANKSQQLKHPDYNNIYNLTICSRSLASELLACGIKKNIPIFAWSNRQLMSGYLSGLFDGDGHVSKDGITLTFGGDIDKKEPWAREVQLALLGFGIRSRVRKYYNPKNGSRVVVQIIAKDCARFSSEIGFMNPVKDKKVKHISPTHKYKSIDSNIYGFSDRVRSVEINEELVDMYDVINSETHRFMVNGVVSHNCNAVATKRAMKLITDRFHERGYSEDTFLVLSVHDELIAECPEKRAEEVKEIVQWGMEAAGEEYIKKVKIVAEAAVCDNWSQKG
jgi:intein/homing endonuclease